MRGTQVEIVISFQVRHLASTQRILYTRPHVIKFTNSSINPQNNPPDIGLVSLRKITNIHKESAISRYKRQLLKFQMALVTPLWLLKKVIKSWNHEATGFLRKCFFRFVVCTFLLYSFLK